MEFFDVSDDEFDAWLHRVLTEKPAAAPSGFRVSIAVSESGSLASYVPDPLLGESPWPIDLGGHGWLDPVDPTDMPMSLMWRAFSLLPPAYGRRFDSGWWRCSVSQRACGELPFRLRLDYEPHAAPTGSRVEWRAHLADAAPGHGLTVDSCRFDDDGVLVDAWELGFDSVPPLSRLTALAPWDGTRWVRAEGENLIGWVMLPHPPEVGMP